MTAKLKNRLANLVSVKGLVTLVLTCVFAYLAIAGKIAQDFMTVYAVIIAFYFGTQSQKLQDSMDGTTNTTQEIKTVKLEKADGTKTTTTYQTSDQMESKKTE